MIFWQNPDWLTAFATVLASATGLAALYFSFRNLSAQRQLTIFQIKTSIKEKWVNDFRNDLAAFLTLSANINDLQESGIPLERLIESGNASAEIKDAEKKLRAEYDLCRNEAYKLRCKILLFINEKDSTHSELITYLNAWDKSAYEWKETLISNSLNDQTREKFLAAAVKIQSNIASAAKKVIDHELKEVLSVTTPFASSGK